jgi:shikimate dehydrogenase
MKYGLIGKSLSHSYSKKIFEQKFQQLNLNTCTYQLYELRSIYDLQWLLLKENFLAGLNITIPYKEEIIPLLDEVDAAALEVGAVNTIKISRQNGNIILKGFNTDVFGFKESLLEFIPEEFNSPALVLGSGGASKAVAFVLNEIGIPFNVVSRNGKGSFSYDDLTKEVIAEHKLIINTTPLGMYPDVTSAPEIPYEHLSEEHFLFDLVYNPEETQFLQNGKNAGAKTKNGIQMLKLQADRAWEIWREE